MPTQDIEVLLQARRFRVVVTREGEGGGQAPTREVIRHPGAVAILPLLDDGRVCLIRNRRLSVDQVLIELPAGTLDPGEDPRTTALRELREETGYEAGQMRLLHSFFLSPGILDERMHLFLAEGLHRGETELQPDEEIQTLLVTWEEAQAMALDGRIQDAKTLVGLLFYDRLRVANSRQARA